MFTAEAVLKLAQTAGDRGAVESVDSFALIALGMFEIADPRRAAEVREVQGLALLAADEATKLRAVELLRNAVESREDQLAHQGGSAEPLSRSARESRSRAARRSPTPRRARLLRAQPRRASTKIANGLGRGGDERDD